jgi:hypothetical protein
VTEVKKSKYHLTNLHFFFVILKKKREIFVNRQK